MWRGINMSFSIYYKAERKNYITENEKKNVLEVVSRYSDNYPFDNKVEDFVVYPFQNNTSCIFEGATKLPSKELQLMFDTANYWLKCLTEITYILKNSKWHVNFDDVELIWDQQEGWRFPNDIEYNE